MHSMIPIVELHLLLHCVTGVGHEPEVAPSLPVFSPPVISDHLAESSLDHSPLVDEYSSSDGSAEDEPDSSDCCGMCVCVHCIVVWYLLSALVLK